jgi:transcriptional regulator with XRE-family HTH domain
MEQLPRRGSGMRLKDVREAAGMTQEQLAHRAGVALRTVQRAEAGNDPSLAVLRKIAAAMSIDVAELLESAA